MDINLSNNWNEWKAYAKGKRVVKLVIDEYTVFANTKDYPSHRDFIADAFRYKGFEVTKWGHSYGASGSVLHWGLVYSRADSDIRSIIEIYGIVGENLRERTSDEKSNTKVIEGIS